jgi:hypothetical protein
MDADTANVTEENPVVQASKPAEADLIKSAVEAGAPGVPVPEDTPDEADDGLFDKDLISQSDAMSEVEQDMAELEQKVHAAMGTPDEPSPTVSPQVSKTTVELADTALTSGSAVVVPDVAVDEGKEIPAPPCLDTDPASIAVVAEQARQQELSQDNPLGLEGALLKGWNEIRAKYPQFVLYNGEIAFKNFYFHKVRGLLSTLTRFTLLDLASMRKELHATPIDHTVGDDEVSEDLLRGKLDQVQQCRVRVGALHVKSLEQYGFWKEQLSMLTSKLIKDHGARGSEKEALVLEHLIDIKEYVTDLHSFVEAAKHIFNLLNSSYESLSRQLTCLNVREHSSFRSPDSDTKHRPPKAVAQANPSTVRVTEEDMMAFASDIGSGANDEDPLAAL